MLKKGLFLSLFLYRLFASSEPSAYGAGDLESASPYGLTPEEKVLLETKKKLQHVEVKTNLQENQVDSLRERIDGLQTVVEGIAKRNHENRLKIQELLNQLQKDEIGVSEFQKRVEALTIQNGEVIETLKQNIQELNATIQEKYVTKSELQSVVDELNRFKKLVATELKELAKNSSSSLDNLSKSEILNRAYRYYKKKNYSKAIEYYKYLLAHNYKPARSSYMLGEIYYYKRDYATAIAYFKESAKRYKKAKYMPTLLLHTAVAMKKTGDSKNAQKFFELLVKKYPNSKEAKSAKKYMK